MCFKHKYNGDKNEKVSKPVEDRGIINNENLPKKENDSTLKKENITNKVLNTSCYISF